MSSPADFFARYPEIETLEAFCVDVNGIPRGKRIPAKGAEKVFDAGLRLPFSALAVDSWGADVPAAGLVVETGDRDGVCRAVPGSLRAVPWHDKTAQVMMSMFDGAGAPFHGDPRQVLKNVLDLYAAQGWTPVVAAELEFYLIDAHPDARGYPQPPVSKRTGRRAEGPENYSMREMDDFAEVLDDVTAFCRALDIPAETTISEAGAGQFEINLLHVPDALAAADHAIQLKRAIKGAAHKHGVDATFMAKPYSSRSGNGMHVHFSVLDKTGANIFAGQDEKGSDALRHALGGLLVAMPDSTAILAPNLNSYRRFRAGSHAPTTLSWGYDNRSAALRVPASPVAATRIEHRVAGADVNPYLALAVMLAGAYDGMMRKIEPGAAYEGDVYSSDAARLPASWGAALDLFAGSAFIEKYLGAAFRDLFLACKQQEKEKLDAEVTSAEFGAYLRDA